MKVRIPIQVKSSESKVFASNGSDDRPYKACPYCGQNPIPFKMGVCICGKQVGNIRYVKNAKTYAKNWHSYVGDVAKIEKLGIKELEDN